uniref:Endonuclease/exonuclease/phosphatase domain-containing protein n=1 Tax=Cannabis sativa TaxID=3483 RepID=A0A803NJN6_CANSA
MDPLLNDLNAKLSLTDEEKSIFTIPEYDPAPLETNSYTLLARVLATQHIYKPNFIDQMSGHPFKRCIAFMEHMDNGNDDDFQYGPRMNGVKLPTNNYDHYWADFPKGLSGGLMILWKDDVDIALLNYGPSFFDCNLTFDGSNSFHLTCFYGASDVASRPTSWTLLRRVADVASLNPWSVIGDFNKILSINDKFRGALRNETHMEAFRNTLDGCRLFETPYEGDHFTWIKCQKNVKIIKERLDWCFVNNHWEGCFPMPQIHHLYFYQSDHRVITTTINTLESTTNN